LLRFLKSLRNNVAIEQCNNINSMKKNITTLIIVAIVAIGAGFFGGLQYQKMADSKLLAKFPAGAGFNRGNFTGSVNNQRARAGAGFTQGTILSKSDKSLTVKLAAGGSEIVFLADSTEIMKSATGTIADLNVGENVVVSGTANSDGSITARTVQLGVGRPDFGQGQGQGGQTTPGQPSGQMPGQPAQVPPTPGQ
jgi:hypothetical protein